VLSLYLVCTQGNLSLLLFEKLLKMSLRELHPETIPIGNVSTAQQVFKEHGDFIRRTIQFHIGNKPEADDLFQDLFLFLVLKPLPEDIHDIRSLLYRVITARVIDKFRYENRIKTFISKYAQMRELTGEFQEDSLVETEEAEKMFSLIQKHLPRNEALVIMLRYKYGLDIGETAKKMGVKPRSVSHYLSTAISKIRCVLKDKYEEIL
jgi:RNA polymerase sigma factor (sigma-70 family)